tara:strand:+ start:22700 stop:23077 length:378 start_codon:yes stop_codon:yes gene_type:complete
MPVTKPVVDTKAPIDTDAFLKLTLRDITLSIMENIDSLSSSDYAGRMLLASSGMSKDSPLDLLIQALTKEYSTYEDIARKVLSFDKAESYKFVKRWYTTILNVHKDEWEVMYSHTYSHVTIVLGS